MNVITIGGATQDIFLTYQGADSMVLYRQQAAQQYMLFQSGEKVEINNITYTVGGGATNAAISFKQLGFNVSIVSCVGTDAAGDSTLQLLQNFNIDTSLVTRNEHHETGKSFIVNSLARERTIFVCRGANKYLDLTLLGTSKLQKANLIYITSLSSRSAMNLVALIQDAHALGIPVVMNPGGSQLSGEIETLKTALKQTQTLIMNSAEAHTLMTTLMKNDDHYRTLFTTSCALPLQNCTTLTCEAFLLTRPIVYENQYFSMQAFFKELLSMGPKHVVVTNGENGVYLATQDALYYHPSIKTNVVDTVGAGDAFGSCFSASIAQGYSIEDSLRRGIASSTSVLAYIGAKEGLLTAEAITAQAASIPKNLIQKMSFWSNT